MTLYDIKPRQTLYKNVLFRSRLEAKWAAFFDLLGWEWQYEPFDTGNWSPDFSIITHDGHILVEVKPISKCVSDAIPKMQRNHGEHLLLGLGPSDGGAMAGMPIGWFVVGDGNEPPDFWGEHGDSAILTRVLTDRGERWDVISDIHSFGGRITGAHDGDHHIRCVDHSVIQALWATASTVVRWEAVQRG